MFGNLGSFMNLMKNAGQLKDSLRQVQERLAAARFTGEAGGGQVRATVDGRGELTRLKIEPGLVRSGDLELLEDLTCAAVRAAVAQSRAALEKEMRALADGLGLDLPGLGSLLGGGAL